MSKDGHVLLLSDETRATVAGEPGRRHERADLLLLGQRPGVRHFAGRNALRRQQRQRRRERRVRGLPAARRAARPARHGFGRGADTRRQGSRFTTNLTGSHATLTVRPIGPGQSRTIDLGGLMLRSHGASKSDRLVRRPSHRPGPGQTRRWERDVRDGPRRRSPRRALAGGANLGDHLPDALEGRGHSDAKRGVTSSPPAAASADRRRAERRHPLAWSPDGRSISLRRQNASPRIYRTELVGGRRELVRELVSADPAGIVYGWLILSPDGRFYLQRFRRMLTTVEYVTLRLKSARAPSRCRRPADRAKARRDRGNASARMPAR